MLYNRFQIVGKVIVDLLLDPGEAAFHDGDDGFQVVGTELLVEGGFFPFQFQSNAVEFF